MTASIQAHRSEDRIRAMFQDYVQNIVDIAFDDAEFPDDATRRKVRDATAPVHHPTRIAPFV